MFGRVVFGTTFCHDGSPGELSIFTRFMYERGRIEC